ncbi:MAG: hypothetical protein ACFFBD_09510 [Candidatus Hodarchaeota archaeon]
MAFQRLVSVLSDLNVKSYFERLLDVTVEEQRKKIILLLQIILIMAFSIVTLYRFVIELMNGPPQIGYDLATLFLLNLIFILSGIGIAVINHYTQGNIAGLLTLLQYLVLTILMYIVDQTFGVVTLSMMIFLILITGLILPRNFLFISLGLIFGMILGISWLSGKLLEVVTISVLLIIIGISIIEGIKLNVLYKLIGNLQIKNKQADFFIDLMSHDLNNVNQAIVTALEYLTYQISAIEGSDVIKPTIKSIFNEVNSGVALIRNVRKFTQIDENLPVEVGGLHHVGIHEGEVG